MLTDVANPPAPPARAPATCAECCRYEMTVQRLREAYELLQAALAASDDEHRRSP